MTSQATGVRHGINPTPSTLRRLRTAISAGVILAATSGCLNTSRQGTPPAEWLAAIKPTARIDISGHYANRGKNRGVKNQVGSPFLQDLFAERGASAGEAVSVQIGQPNPQRLEVLIHQASGQTVSQTIAVDSDGATGAVTLPNRNASFARREGMMAMAGTTTITLFRGADGALYGKFSTHRAGVVMGVIPLGQSEEGWVRWPPVTDR